MKGIILAAGKGTRLRPLTRTQPKCLVNVAGKPMMEYQLDALNKAGIKDCVIVVGYLADTVRDSFGSRYMGMNLTYVENPDYQNSNNLYSLWLARDHFDDDILLLESDLVFDDRLVTQLAHLPQDDVAVVDSFQDHMDGTVILAQGDAATSMIPKTDQGPGFDYESTFKTVNIYRLSKTTLGEAILPGMEEFLQEGQTDQYYESVFADLIGSGEVEMMVMSTGNLRWAEVDDLLDIRNAEEMFSAVCVR